MDGLVVAIPVSSGSGCQAAWAHIGVNDAGVENTRIEPRISLASRQAADLPVRKQFPKEHARVPADSLFVLLGVQDRPSNPVCWAQSAKSSLVTHGCLSGD